jgi:hypothetical protein
MSRKTRQHRRNKEHLEHEQNVQQGRELSVQSVMEGISSRVSPVVGWISARRILVGTIAGCAGAASYLVGTERGRELGRSIQGRMTDLYDSVSTNVRDRLSSETEVQSETESRNQRKNRRKEAA